MTIIDRENVEPGDLIYLCDPKVYKRLDKVFGTFGGQEPTCYLVLEKTPDPTAKARGSRLLLFDLKDQRKVESLPPLPFSPTSFYEDTIFLISRPEKETDSWVTKFSARVSRWLGSFWPTP